MNRHADSRGLKIEDSTSQKEEIPFEKDQNATQKYLDDFTTKHSKKLEDLINDRPIIDTSKSTQAVYSKAPGPNIDGVKALLKSFAENISAIVKSDETLVDSNKITLSNGMEFMKVSAGEFIMGSDPASLCQIQWHKTSRGWLGKEKRSSCCVCQMDRRNGILPMVE